MSELPTGTVAFVMTDIVGSTALWERNAASMAAAVERHEVLIAQAAADANGHVVKSRGEGDSAFLVFTTATDALAAAIGLQKALARETWPTDEALSIRVGIHVGEAQQREADYFAPTVNRCARIKSLAAGGQILVSDIVRRMAAESAGPKFELKDLGSHRLKDLLQPERLWQVCDPDLPADFPAIDSLDQTPNNLPVQLTSFIGRDEDVRALSDLVRAHRLVSLLGPGGSGKTRLGLQVAAEVMKGFPDGVWFVPLATIEDGALVAEAVARVLHIQEIPGKEPVDSIVEALAERSALIVLDNCEQIVEACRGFAKRLLAETPKISVLATSRHQLHVAGERCYPVEPLSVPDLRAALDAATVRQSEAVRLLIDRARARAPHFELTDANAAWIARICARLDGIPLAIELAAPKLGILSPQELYSRLEASLSVLKGGAEQELERHQTIQRTIEWSYRLLSDEEKALFESLAVFAGGWSLAATELVLPSLGSGVFEILQGLIEKSLVIVRTDGENQSRYLYLQIIKEFASERLNENPTREARLRADHFRWIEGLARAAGSEEPGPDQQAAMLALDREEGNVRAALEWILTQDRFEDSLAFVLDLHRHWLWTTQWREGRYWIEQVLRRAGDRAGEGIAKARNILGVFAWYQGDLEFARRQFDASGELWRALGNEEREMGVVNNAGLLAIMSEDFVQARQSLTQCLEFYRARGDERRLSDVAVNLGAMERELQNYEAALSLLSLALDLKQTLNDEQGIATIHASVADCLALSGRPSEALAEIRLSLLMRMKLGNDLNLADSFEILAYVASGQDPEFAARLLGVDEALWARSDAPPGRWQQHLRDLARAAVSARLAPADLSKIVYLGRVANPASVAAECLQWIEDHGRDYPVDN